MNGTEAHRSRRRLAPAGLLILTATVAATTAPTYAEVPEAQARCAWKVVAAPSPGIGAVALRGVDAVAARNIWAVGSKNAQGATLAEHWNGKRWSVVSTPDKSSYTQLEDVTAINADNVWAVGFYVPRGGSHPKTLVEHWNGKRWSVVPSPNPRKGNNVLFGVDAISGKNIWAVGGNNFDPSVGSKPITLQWNGKVWRKSAGLPVTSGLQDVSAISAHNVVAVGHTRTVPLVQRYNGNRWTSVPTGTASTTAHLQAVSARSATAEWAVGQQTGTAALQPLTVRNMGSGWQEVAGTNSATTAINVLHGVTTLSANQAWAVGDHENGSFVRRTMVQHYSSGQWSIVASPNPTSHNASLLDFVVTRGDIWAVGYSTTASFVQHVLIESRRC